MSVAEDSPEDRVFSIREPVHESLFKSVCALILVGLDWSFLCRYHVRACNEAQARTRIRA